MKYLGSPNKFKALYNIICRLVLTHIKYFMLRTLNVTELQLVYLRRGSNVALRHLALDPDPWTCNQGQRIQILSQNKAEL
jgi:hypothetical protein